MTDNNLPEIEGYNKEKVFLSNIQIKEMQK